EKAGIFRPHRPAIYGGLNAPKSLVDIAIDQEAELLLAGRDYIYRGISDASWQFHGPHRHYAELPVPALKGQFQLQNAAAVIMALHALADQLPVDATAIGAGLKQAHIMGRFQRLQQAPDIVVDVAHNAQSARALAEILADDPIRGKTLVVIGMLADKAIDQVITALAPGVDHWFTAGLEVPRGLSAELMAKAVNDYAPGAKLAAHDSVITACAQAMQCASEHDRIIILGSFYTVSQATDYLQAL
ncbi:MAG: bifunctional folylpolyglutamate synthase/dihydrofolate synthase, partial [Gammaproteobacteria bacterium]|nr:bifunctional folylpolyglutamate synthase/dihydrofolate synthase [Gammaproteobacteria bacterium]